MTDEFLIWEKKFLVDEGYCIITRLQGFKEVWLLQNGVVLSDKWPDSVTFSMDLNYPKAIKLLDIQFGASVPVVSGRVKEILMRLAGSSRIEFLPVTILNHKGRVASKDYFIVNPLDIVDCIDVEKSVVVWNAINTSAISSCKKFVLKEKGIPKTSVIFRPKSWLHNILVRREMADKMSAAELTGLCFLESSKFTG